MADKLMRAVVTLTRNNGVPEDNITNTWHFDGDDGASDSAYHNGVVSLLNEFYDNVATYIAQLVSNTLSVSIYDMRDPTPRVPEFTDTFDIAAGAGAHMPAEVAVCMSYFAAPVSGVPQARRRGRIYLGPINQAGITSTGGDVRPNTTMIDAIAAAGNALRQGFDLVGTGSIRWAVYSPTIDATQSVDDAFSDVSGGWVDNAFDTQRRRGASATLRSTFP